MNLPASVGELLSRRLGLAPELLGAGVIERALDVVFRNARPENRASMAAHLLEAEGEEWQTLVDEVIVPETWFFRNREPFQFLASYVTEKWRRADLTRPFQALCIPCASGEEAYSIAMTLRETGLEASRIRIDAADISERLLGRARRAVYGEKSFREKSGHFREQYFGLCEEGWRVREEIARLVRFEKANLLELSSFHERAPYDAIFCRNALIYLNERARHEVVSGIRELLHEEGLLFTGHSELPHFCEAGFVPVDRPHSFACRKGEPRQERVPANSAPAAVTAVKYQRTTTRVPPADAERFLRVLPAPVPPVSFEQARQLADRGDLDAATAVCERLLQGGVQDPEVYALLAVLAESRGSVERAEELFRKALYLAPDHYESLLHMSLLCERRGDMEGSRLYRARASRALTSHEAAPVLKGL